MRRNFIDQAALGAEIANTVVNIPAAVKPFSDALSSLFHRYLPELDLGIRALPSEGDPAWSHKKAADGEVLYRLERAGLIDARRTMIDFLLALEKAAWIADSPTHPHGRIVRKALAGMTHWKPVWSWREPEENSASDLAELIGLEQLLREAGKAEKTRRSSEPIAATARIVAGGLSGQRMTSIQQIMALGREANNCLARPHYARDVVHEGKNVWALRSGATLVAVMSVSSSGIVTELRGLANHQRLGSRAADIALFCQRAKLRVSDEITIPLADLLPPENQFITFSPEISEEEMELERLLAAA